MKRQLPNKPVPYWKLKRNEDPVGWGFVAAVLIAVFVMGVLMWLIPDQVEAVMGPLQRLVEIKSPQTSGPEPVVRKRIVIFPWADPSIWDSPIFPEPKNSRANLPSWTPKPLLPELESLREKYHLDSLEKLPETIPESPRKGRLVKNT